MFPITRLFIKETQGKENIPGHGNFIIAANHITGWDHCFIGDAFEERIKELRFIGAMDSWKTFFLSGLLYYLSNTITVNRKKVDRETLLERMIECLKDNKIIVIYPEGDSNQKKELLKGKTGVAEMILKSEVPLVMVGTRRIKGSRRRTVKIGKPLYFEKERQLAKGIKNKEEYHLLLRKVTDKIMLEISELCHKPYPYLNYEN